MKTPNEQVQIAPLMASINAAGRMLGVCRATVYKLMDSGVLESTKFGSARRVTVESIRRAATGSRRGSHQPKGSKRRAAVSPGQQEVVAPPPLAALEG
jgi:excisionase family DNA binding protein